MKIDSKDPKFLAIVSAILSSVPLYISGASASVIGIAIAFAIMGIIRSISSKNNRTLVENIAALLFAFVVFYFRIINKS